VVRATESPMPSSCSSRSTMGAHPRSALRPRADPRRAAPRWRRAAAFHQLERQLLERLVRAPLEARDELLGGGAADLDDRRADARERRRLRGAEVGVVDAGDGDLVGNAHALLAARQHATDREHVVGRDHRRRSLLEREQLAHHGGRGAEVDRTVARAALVEREAGLRQRRAHAGSALGGSVVARGRGAEQTEAAMAEGDQVARHLEGRRSVVEADARMAPHRVDAPGEHVRPAVALEQREQCRVVVQPDEDEGVDPVADQLLGDAQLRLQVVVVLGKHERVALRVEHRLQRARRARVQRVVERGHDGSHHLAAMAAQCTRRAVRHVMQLAHRLVDQPAGLGVDLFRRVDGARDRGGRDAGETRHVLRIRTLPVAPDGRTDCWRDRHF
jgi:hypothetical protein